MQKLGEVSESLSVLGKDLHEKEKLEEVLLYRKNKKDKKDNHKEQMRKEIIDLINNNPSCFDIDARLKHLENLKNLGALKKEKMYVIDKLENFDIEKYQKNEEFRNELFSFVNQNNLNVGMPFLEKIAKASSKREFKYLMYQLKEKYKLSFEDLERTHKSLFMLFTPMGNQMR